MSRVLTFATLLFAPVLLLAAEPSVPNAGDLASDFTLESLQGEKVTLLNRTQEGPVVVVVLRGWPGYQCPICTRQVAQFAKKQQELTQAGAQVLLIYPGPADELLAHAKEFFGTSKLPEKFTALIDPDFQFTNAWHLRWDAPRRPPIPRPLWSARTTRSPTRR